MNDRCLPTTHTLLTLFFITVLGLCFSCGKVHRQSGAHADTDSLIAAYRAQGKSLREKSHFSEAITAHQQELALASRVADTLSMVQALNNIGTNFRRMGILDEASDNHYKALRICSAYSGVTTDSTIRKNRVVALNGIGNIYLSLGNYETADSAFRQALAGEKSLGSGLGQAINYANIGAVYEGLHRTDSAWHYYRLSMEANRRIHSDLGVSLCHNHFGRLYENSGETQKAIAEYTHAYDIMSHSADRWHWLESCVALARIHVAHDKIAEARHYIDEALDEAQRQHSIEYLADIYLLKYELARKTGNIPLALECFVRGKAYKDSVSSEKNYNRLQTLHNHYTRVRHQADIDRVNADLLVEKRWKTGSIIVAVLVAALALVIVGFLYYALLNRKRRQRIMMQAEKARTVFYTNVTHEFRTPLTVILGYSEMMERGELPAADMTSVGSVVTRQGRLLLSLVNQLLDISRIKSSVAEPEWRSGNIIKYVSVMVDSFQHMARNKNIVLSYRHVGEEGDTNFVPEYLQKVVNNLVHNAIKFTPDGGHVTVALDVQSQNMALTVSDDGCGIPAEEQSHVFDLFWQSDTPQHSGGSGVGLSLVRQIAESLGGSATVESEMGHGTTFRIVIPQHAGHFPPLVEPETSVQTPCEETQAGDDRPTVLIIEDNADVSDYMQIGLKKHYRLLVAHDGEEGLAMATDQVPDIIVTDLMMPRMDGQTLCRLVRKSEVLAHIPVIMVTAKSTDADRLQGLRDGADAYVFKPFNAEELQVRIANLLERQHRMRQLYSQAVSENDPHPEARLSETDRSFLEKIRQAIIEKMASGEINVETVASSLCLSSQQLRRKLSAITGETPAAHIRQVQMGEARNMLETAPEKSVSEVAMACGFYDTSHFTRIFKSVYGVTPSKIRQKN